MSFHRTIYFYIIFVKIIAANSDNSDSERQIVKFKKDIDRIGSGFEDLIFDAIDGIVKDAQLLINADYDDEIGDNSLSKITQQKPYKLKNLIKNEPERATVSLGKYRKKRSIDVVSTPDKLSNVINKETEDGISSLKNFLKNLKPIKSDIANVIKVPSKIIETLTKPETLIKRNNDLKGIAGILKDLNPLHLDYNNIQRQIELQSLKNFFDSVKPTTNGLGVESNFNKKSTSNIASLNDVLKELVPVKHDFANDVRNSISNLGNIIKQGTDSAHFSNVLNNISPTENKFDAFTKMLKNSNNLQDAVNKIVSVKLDNKIIKEFETTTMGILDNFIKRSKRSAASDQPVTVVEPPLIDKEHTAEAKSDCKRDTDLESHRIQELKEEIKNLHDIVVLLKDQQNVMSFLDHETKDVDDNFAERYSKKDLLKILEHLGDTSLDDFGPRTVPEHNTESTVHEELEKLRSDLKKAEYALNKTRQMITYDKQIEKSLQDEIKRHRTELNLLKVVVKRMLKNNTSSEDEPILGATFHPPKGLPGARIPTTREVGSQEARASNLGNLGRLIQDAIDRRNRENSLTNLLKHLSGQTSTSGRDLSDESELLRVLQLAARLIEQPIQGRIDDTDSELKRLQNAIEFLRPKEEINLPDTHMIDDRQLNALIDRLSKENGPSPTKALQNTPTTIPADRYQELLKLLQSRDRPKNPVGQNMGHRPLGNLVMPDIGYGGLSSGGSEAGPANAFHNRYQNYRPLFYSSPSQYPRPPPTQPYGYSRPSWIDFTPARSPSIIPYQDYEPPQAFYRPPMNFGGELPPYYRPFEGDPSQQLYRPLFNAGGSPPQPIYRPPPISNYGNEHIPSIHRPQQNFGAPPTSNFGNEPPQSVYRPQPSFAPSPLDKEQQPGPGGFQFFPGSGYDVPPQNSGPAQEVSGANGGETSGLYTPADNESNMNGDNTKPISSYNPNLSNVDQNIPQPPQQPNFPKPLPNPPPLGYVKKRTRRAVDPSSYPVSQLYDELTNSLKRYIFEGGSRGHTYNYGQRRTEDLKAQLERLRTGSQQRSNEYPPAYHLPMPLQPLYNPNLMQDYTKPSILNPVTNAKPDIIGTIIVKILDHVINAVPTIIERIFGRGIYDLVNFNDYGYNDNNGYSYYGKQNDLQKLFRGLGILGYGPLIFLKIVDGFTTFFNILRRNSFFRTFLLPALVLLLIAGSVIFLIWWLQPNDTTSYNYNNAYQGLNGQNQYNNYNQHQYDRNHRKNNYYYGGTSYNHQGNMGYSSQNGNNQYSQQGGYVNNYI